MRQIGGDALRPRKNETLKATVERDIKKRKLQKKYDALEKKVWNENQPNKQMEMSAELKRLKKVIEEL